MLQGYFKTIPQELEEAGLVDGLTRVGVILRITLPLSLPAIVSVSLFIFMVAWNEYLFAYMFLDTPDIFTLPWGLEQLDGEEVPKTTFNGRFSHSDCSRNYCFSSIRKIFTRRPYGWGDQRIII